MADILSFLETCSTQKISQDSKRRLQKHVQSELSYLSRATRGAGAEPASLSSNLNHLEAIASLLKLPEVSCVVGVLQTIRFQKGLLSIAAPNLKDDTELSTTAVDLICLFKGEPAWVVVSARNPDYIKWQKPRTEEKPAFPPNCSQDPFNSENTCASLSTTQGCSPSTLRVLSKQAEGFSESLSDNLPCQTRRPTPTHDTCLKDRIVGLLDAAQGSSTLHRPSKIVLCFARGLQASFQTLISESFGVVICPLIQPVGFEILLNPAPNQEQTKQSFEFGAQPLASPEADPSKEKLPAKMAPESEALAWSLVEGLPSPSPLARHPSPSGDVSKGADGFSKEWIVLEDPSVDPVQDDLASASRREEETVVSGGLNPNESGVRGQVMDAVRRLENPRGSLKGGRYAEARECTKQGELEALQTAPGLESSFVAIDGPEGSFEGEDSQGQGNMVNEVDPGTKTLAVVENGWVAVRLGVEDVLDRQSSVPNGSKVEEKEWVALSLAAGLQNEAMAGTEVTGGSKEYEQGGQWVGIQQPELTSEDSGAVAGEWIGVARSIGESEQNTNSERTDRNGTWSNGTKGDPISGLEEVSGKDGRRERTGDERDRLERAKAGRNGIFGNGFEANVSSGRTMAEDAPGSAEGRFRTLNQVPLNERPASWPAGLELLNLDTTALVALVSAITNGAAEGLRAMPEQEFRERWKGNAGFMRDQVEAELQYPQLPYLESVTADKALLVTQYVLREFVSIVSVVGGEEEQARAERVLKRCWLIADSPSDRLRSLPSSRAIKARHVAIFGTADAWACPTLTSNAAFARAVQKQGVPLWVLEHRPSALVGC